MHPRASGGTKIHATMRNLWASNRKKIFRNAAAFDSSYAHRGGRLAWRRSWWRETWRETLRENLAGKPIRNLAGKSGRKKPGRKTTWRDLVSPDFRHEMPSAAPIAATLEQADLRGLFVGPALARGGGFPQFRQSDGTTPGLAEDPCGSAMSEPGQACLEPRPVLSQCWLESRLA